MSFNFVETKIQISERLPKTSLNEKYLNFLNKIQNLFFSFDSENAIKELLDENESNKYLFRILKMELEPLSIKMNDDCPICFNNRKRRFLRTSCGHIFCKSCLKSHLKISDECPLCRTEFDWALNFRKAPKKSKFN
jgi:late competence protein required for DNA uptake (superfamily II DNA/RNA helicase)